MYTYVCVIVDLVVETVYMFVFVVAKYYRGGNLCMANGVHK